MTSAQMWTLARDAVAEKLQSKPDDVNTPDVLWVGGALEQRRAVVWCGTELYLVTYNTLTGETRIDTYVKRTEVDGDDA